MSIDWVAEGEQILAREREQARQTEVTQLALQALMDNLMAHEEERMEAAGERTSLENTVLAVVASTLPMILATLNTHSERLAGVEAAILMPRVRSLVRDELGVVVAAVDEIVGS